MDIWDGATVHDTSCPGVPQTNSIAEGKVKKTVNGTRVSLMTAGLPHCYWPLAAQTYAQHFNMKEVKGESPWVKRHKEQFAGTGIPFGCAIDFIPSPIYRGTKNQDVVSPGGPSSGTERTAEEAADVHTIKKDTTKFDPKMIPGIFLGYKLHSGCRWNGEYLVANIDEFATLNFHRSCKGSEHNIHIQTVREVRHLDDTFQFPLREAFERDNRTIGGIRSRLIPDANAYDCPPPSSSNAERITGGPGGTNFRRDECRQ